jgi:predicted dehydrogenase
MVNAARKYGRMIQCGTQSRSSPSLKEAVKFVQDGNLGSIQYAVGTCYKPRPSIGKLESPLSIPSYIDYNLWCGPAAMLPIYRPQLHYDWHWDFNTGNGDMGNQGIHQMDIARWFLGEKALSPRVTSIGGRLGYIDAGNTPNTQIVYHDYERAPLVFETRGLPSGKGSREMDQHRGSRVGVIVQCKEGYVVIPSYSSATAFTNDGQEIRSWKSSGDHFANFLAAVRSRNRSDLNAEVLEGHLSSALCHTGNIAHRLGQMHSAKEIASDVGSNPLLSDSFQRMANHLDANEVDIEGKSITVGPWLEMDPQTERFTTSDEANQLLRRRDRAPFLVPEVNV